MSAPGSRGSAGSQVLITSVAVVVALAVGFVVSSVPAALDSLDAKRAAENAKASSQNGDFAGVISSVEALRSDAQAMGAYMSTPAWFLASLLPGTPAGKARNVVVAASDVAAESGPFLDFADQLQQSQGDTLIPTEAIDALAASSGDLATAISNLDAQLSNFGNQPLGPLQSMADKAIARAHEVLPQVSSLANALPAISQLLGSEAPQTWFVAFQNAGESRGTGGLVGSFSAVVLNKGDATVQTVGANDLLTAKANPNLLPKDSRDLWGAARLAEIFGVNFSPNYPYAGELLASLWEKQSGTAPDAVLSFDQLTAVALISAAGPFTIDGVTVTGDNAFQLLTVGLYTKYSNAADKDAFVTTLIEQLMGRIISKQVPPTKIAAALMSSVLNGGVLLWARSPEQQAQLGPSLVGGMLPDQPGPFAMAVVNNNAGNKMDTFLHTSVAYIGGECIAGGRRSQVRVQLFNDPPTWLPKYVGQRGDKIILDGETGDPDGSNRVRLAVYLPTGALVADSEPRSLYLGQERNHPVAMFGVEILPQQTATLTVNFTEFGSPEELNRTPRVPAQLMLNPQQITVTQGPEC